MVLKHVRGEWYVFVKLLLLEFYFSFKRVFTIKRIAREDLCHVVSMCYQSSFSGNIQDTWENVHKLHAIRIVAESGLATKLMAPNGINP